MTKICISKIKRGGFTLVELLAVIVILAIILAIAALSITNIIDNATKNSFEEDAKMLLKAINYKQMQDSSVDIESLEVKEDLNLSDNNYDSVTISTIDGKPNVLIVGKNKWAGLKACGTFQSIMIVPASDSENCVTATVSSAPLNLGTSYSSGVVLSWSAPADNGDSPIIGYKIERKKDSGSWTVLVANTGTTTTTYNDTTVVGIQGIYTYRVAAINAIGTSTYSNEASYSIACFLADTTITMADGTYKPIVDIQIGDQVLSYDGEKIVTDTVIHKFVENMNDDSYYLKITTNDKVIRGVTPNHPIYVVGESEKKKEADQLQVGDVLLTDSNNTTIITKIEKIYQPNIVYTLTIEDNHNFFADGILVSNKPME